MHVSRMHQMYPASTLDGGSHQGPLEEMAQTLWQQGKRAWREAILGAPLLILPTYLTLRILAFISIGS